MSTALIIVIAAAVILAIILVARLARGRVNAARREKAGELRVEATRAQERAKRAEIRAEEEREAAKVRAQRADKIDPDTGGPRRRLFGRNRDDEAADYDGDDERSETDADARPSLRERLTRR